MSTQALLDSFYVDNLEVHKYPKVIKLRSELFDDYFDHLEFKYKLNSACENRNHLKYQNSILVRCEDMKNDIEVKEFGMR